MKTLKETLRVFDSRSPKGKETLRVFDSGPTSAGSSGELIWSTAFPGEFIWSTAFPLRHVSFIEHWICIRVAWV
jgi:hypothetical protein